MNKTTLFSLSVTLLLNCLFFPFDVHAKDKSIYPKIENSLELQIEKYTNNSRGWPALHYAIDQKRLDVVLEILKKHPEQQTLCTPFEDGIFINPGPYMKGLGGNHKWKIKYSDALKLAFRENGIGYLERLGVKEPWPTYPFYPKFVRGSTPLELAIENGFIELVKSLLDGKADVNAKRAVIQNVNKDEMTVHLITPLSLAIQKGDPEMIQLLLDHGANQTQCLRTLEISIFEENKKGAAEVKRIDHEWMSAFTAAAKYDAQIALKQLIFNLNEKIVPVEFIPDEFVHIYHNALLNPLSTSILQQAILRNDYKTIALLEQNMEVLRRFFKNCPEQYSFFLPFEGDGVYTNPGPYWSEFDAGGNFAWSIKYSDAINLATGLARGMSPLEFACTNGFLELAKELIDLGVDLNVQRAIVNSINRNIMTIHILTPLAIAIESNNEEMIQLLLEHNANQDECLREVEIEMTKAWGSTRLGTAKINQKKKWVSALSLAEKHPNDRPLRLLINHSNEKNLIQTAF